jgi:hypothetical protein
MTFSIVLQQRYKKFLDNPSAIFYFIKRNIYDQFVADKHVPLYKKLRFLSAEETLNKIITEDLSIVRFGDGEFGLMRGASVYFNDWRQIYSKELKEGLIATLSSHNPKLLICVSGQFLTATKSELGATGKGDEARYWINSKMLFRKYMHIDKDYGNSFAFYPQINTKIDFAQLRQYFNTKHIIIITSSTQRFLDIKLGKTTSFVEAPKSDAWNKIAEIREQFNNLVISKKLNSGETLVMVSMGPGAKVFAHELAERGFTAWDAGQFFDLAFKEIKKLSLWQR